jgi:hypothetical protein
MFLHNKSVRPAALTLFYSRLPTGANAGKRHAGSTVPPDAIFVVLNLIRCVQLPDYVPSSCLPFETILVFGRKG